MNEINFDGIVGQTHNYSGLSFGNLASMAHKNVASNPKEAALQGLQKMKLMHDLGAVQAVIPPQERPHIPTLRKLGFTGTDRHLPEKAFHADPQLLYLTSSASSMWAANAATFTPSSDSGNGKVQITPANLSAEAHRAIEAEETAKILKALFPSQAFFTHHAPLPSGKLFCDEGAANHSRFCREHGEMGVHLFVFGAYSLRPNLPKPSKFPARQTKEATEAVIRLHNIFPERVVLAQQSPAAIDAGVFHSDVICLGDKNLFFYHESAFINQEQVIRAIKEKMAALCDCELLMIEVKESEIPLKTAVETYLFNSQFYFHTENTFSLIAPIECQENPLVQQFLARLSQDPNSPLGDIHFVNLRESMRNGGGPACLRTRVVLTENERNALNQKCLFNDLLFEKLKSWIEKHYRDTLTPQDLKDPHLVDEVQTALHELTRLLELGNIYSFQGTTNRLR